MGIDRRTFLQRAGMVLLGVGGGEIGMSRLAQHNQSWERYVQVLAAPAPRKLALLIGINSYPRTSLKGCLTDVEQQRELLIHRFGFVPGDIVTLTNGETTRNAVETAFREHLGSAQPGDAVVFHFSGYGGMARIQGMDTPVPCLLGSDSLAKGDFLNAVPLETLLLLARSLATDRVTLVLDTSYSPAQSALQGSLRVRSYPQSLPARLSDEAIALYNRLRSEVSDSDRQPIQLAAAASDRFAAEADWGGFSAGVFTYALTQSLWESYAPHILQFSLAQTAQTVERLMGKQQQPQVKLPEQGETLTPYDAPVGAVGGEGVVQTLEKDGTLTMRLAGLPAGLLLEYGNNSQMQLVGDAPEGATVQIVSREGLMAKGRPMGEKATPQVGQLVQEKIRVLSRNPGLIVALDSSLKRIERVDATSAFASVSAVTSTVNAGENPADCLFGKASILGINRSRLAEELSEVGYGVFSLGGIPFPNTVGVKTEAVKSAISRLTPKLETILAAKLCRLTVNDGSSRLGLQATLELLREGGALPIIERTTQRDRTFKDSFLPLATTLDRLPQIAVQSQIRYRLQNSSARPLHCLLFGIDSSGSAIAFYSPRGDNGADPAVSSRPLQDLVINPGETRLFPAPGATSDWVVPGPAGLAEIFIVASIAPFEQTLEVLAQTPHPKGEGERVVDLRNPLEVARALQRDLQAASAIPEDILGSNSSNYYALDVNAWATLGFVYEVV